MGLAQRSFYSISWNAIANIVRISISLLRGVLLARLLAVEIFGLYAGMTAMIAITIAFVDFGLTGAFIHRAPETENEERAAAVHFTLRSLFALVWCLLMSFGVFYLANLEERFPFLVLIAIAGFSTLTETPKTILIRRITHRRIAVIEMLVLVVSTPVSIILASKGADLWSLIAIDFLRVLILVAGYYIWRPVWRPRFAWYQDIVKYFLQFGRRSFQAPILYNMLDRFDDVWIRIILGGKALGFYSRAYRFASYPRQFIAQPVNRVIGGTYAELKYDRKRLSQAFFRTNAVLIRVGFFVAGLLALTAPELIRILLTKKWLPMLDVFRLMLIFTMFDPLKLAISNVLSAVGRPERIVYTRWVQLMVLIVGIATLSPIWGTLGVAIAVDLMLMVGIVIFLFQVQDYVDFSIPALFSVPFLALVVGMVLARGALLIPGVLGNDWRTGLVKTTIFVLCYGFILLLTERQQMVSMAQQLSRSVICQ